MESVYKLSKYSQKIGEACRAKQLDKVIEYNKHEIAYINKLSKYFNNQKGGATVEEVFTVIKQAIDNIKTQVKEEALQQAKDEAQQELAKAKEEAQQQAKDEAQQELAKAKEEAQKVNDELAQVKQQLKEFAQKIQQQVEQSQSKGGSKRKIKK